MRGLRPKERRLASEPPRIQGSRNQKNQDSKTQRSLRREPRRRAIVVIGTRHIAGAELHLAAIEVEEGSARELAVGTRSEFIARAVDQQIVVVHEPFRVGQDHDADGERAETELVAEQDFAHATDGATAVTQTELGRNDEDVVVLLLECELLEHGTGPRRLAELVFTEFAFAVVIELAVARLLDRVDDLLHRFAVGRGHGFPFRDGEPTFGALGHFALGDLLAGVSELGEGLAQDVGLLGDALGLLVAREVTERRLHFLVLVAVGDRQVVQRSECRDADCFDELVAVFDDALCTGIVEAEFGDDLLDSVRCEPVDLLDLAGCCLVLSNPVHGLSLLGL